MDNTDDVEVDIESESPTIEEENETEAETADSALALSNVNQENPNQRSRIARLPLARIKTIMKKDNDCSLLSSDAVFLVTKATEMFIEYMTRECGKQLATMGKRKTIMKKDVDTVIQSFPQLCFLDGALD